MTIQDVAFTEKINKLRQGFREMKEKHGFAFAKSIYRVQVRDLCKEFNKNFEEHWHE